MLKNRIISVLLFSIFSFVFFSNKAIGAEGVYNIGINPPDIQFGVYDFYTNMHISDYAAYPGATYYAIIKDWDGEWSIQTLNVFEDSGIPGVYHSTIQPVPGGAEVYLYRDADGPREFLAGVEYNFTTYNQGSLIFTDPSASLPANMNPPWSPPAAPPAEAPPAEAPPAGPSGGAPVFDTDYGDRLMNFSALATQFIIAIAVFSSVFLLPYMGILWASGDPENIKKASEWFFSWLTGLVFLLLSGIIVRIIGTDILSLGM